MPVVAADLKDYLSLACQELDSAKSDELTPVHTAVRCLQVSGEHLSANTCAVLVFLVPGPAIRGVL